MQIGAAFGRECVLPPFFPSPKYTPPIFWLLQLSSPHLSSHSSTLPPLLSSYVYDLPPFQRLQIPPSPQICPVKSRQTLQNML